MKVSLQQTDIVPKTFGGHKPSLDNICGYNATDPKMKQLLNYLPNLLL